jgi:hypothetical protein
MHCGADRLWHLVVGVNVLFVCRYGMLLCIMGQLEDDALLLKHFVTVNNTNLLAVLTVLASFNAYFAVFFICVTYDKRAVIVLYRKGGICEMEL